MSRRGGVVLVPLVSRVRGALGETHAVNVVVVGWVEVRSPPVDSTEVHSVDRPSGSAMIAAADADRRDRDTIGSPGSVLADGMGNTTSLVPISSGDAVGDGMSTSRSRRRNPLEWWRAPDGDGDSVVASWGLPAGVGASLLRSCAGWDSSAMEAREQSGLARKLQLRLALEGRLAGLRAALGHNEATLDASHDGAYHGASFGLSRRLAGCGLALTRFLRDAGVKGLGEQESLQCNAVGLTWAIGVPRGHGVGMDSESASGFIQHLLLLDQLSADRPRGTSGARERLGGSRRPFSSVGSGRDEDIDREGRRERGLGKR